MFFVFCDVARGRFLGVFLQAFLWCLGWFWGFAWSDCLRSYKQITLKPYK